MDCQNAIPCGECGSKMSCVWPRAMSWRRARGICPADQVVTLKVELDRLRNSLGASSEGVVVELKAEVKRIRVGETKLTAQRDEARTKLRDKSIEVDYLRGRNLALHSDLQDKTSLAGETKLAKQLDGARIIIRELKYDISLLRSKLEKAKATIDNCTSNEEILSLIVANNSPHTILNILNSLSDNSLAKLARSITDSFCGRIRR